MTSLCRADSRHLASWVPWLVVAMLIATAVTVVVTFGSGGTESRETPAMWGMTGDRYDWTAAVCADDSLIAPPTTPQLWLPDAIGGASYCMSGPSDVSRGVGITIQEWPRDADVQKALAHRGFSSFAAAQSADATVVFATIVRHDGGSALDPLTRFGVIITPLPCTKCPR